MTSGPADFFIGLQISHDRPKKKLRLSQWQYILRMLKRFHMKKCHPITVPADPHARLDSSMSPSTPEDIQKMSSTPYDERVWMPHLRSSLPSPRYFFCSRPGHPFLQESGKAHWAAVKRILSYLAGTTTHGILFLVVGRTNLVGYTDSDYAGDVNIRRSTSGYIFLHLGGTISWGNKRQSYTAISTTKAEYVAASNAIQEAIWIQRLLSQIEQLPPGPIRILCDNQSVISLVHNPAHHQRT